MGRGHESGAVQRLVGMTVVMLQVFVWHTPVGYTNSQPRRRYSLRAPTNVDAYQPVMLEILTTSPVCGEWMNEPPPT